MQRDDKGVPLCDAAASQEDAFLLHHALRWCRPNAIAYRGVLLPRELLRSLSAVGMVPVRRLVLQSLSHEHHRVDDVLRVRAGTLEELSLLLYREPNFFSALLAGGGRGGGTVGFRFPALRALCLLRQHPADVAKLVAAAPSFSAIRFLFGMPEIDGPRHCGWPAPSCFMGEPDELRPMLETALAPAVGRGQLTSVELDANCRIGVTEVFAELPGLAGFHETLRSVS